MPPAFGVWNVIFYRKLLAHATEESSYNQINALLILVIVISLCPTLKVNFDICVAFTYRQYDPAYVQNSISSGSHWLKAFIEFHARNIFLILFSISYLILLTCLIRVGPFVQKPFSMSKCATLMKQRNTYVKKQTFLRWNKFDSI